jgi:hypothetical protein
MSSTRLAAHDSPFSVRSAPVNITEIGRVHVTLARDGHQTPELIRVEVHIDGPIIFVSFSEETERWPFRIQNDTDLDFEFCQTVSAHLFCPASHSRADPPFLHLRTGRSSLGWYQRLAEKVEDSAEADSSLVRQVHLGAAGRVWEEA